MKEESSKKRRLTRREFISSAAAGAAFTFVPRNVLGGTGRQAPSDRLNIAGIGVGGRGSQDLRDAAFNNNVVALCDVDEYMAGATFLEYPEAKLYKDFRNMLDREQSNIDAVTIATPDHMHATAALWAMERGISVYVEAPLAQTVWESRLLTKAAAKYKVATQMGNQGYSSEATRIVCEVIWAGDIGEITEVHAWNNGSFAVGITEWPAEEEIPETLQWDLWLGRAQERSYSSYVCPYEWRGFQDFGSGVLGDWGIHIMGPAQWALKLSSPMAVECINIDGRNDVSYASGATIKYEFGPRESMPPVTIYWYGGTNTVDNNQNEQAGGGLRGALGGNMQSMQARGGRGGPSVPYTPPGLTAQSLAGFNQVFIGTKGYLCTGGRGQSVTLFPQSRMEGYKVPEQILERSPGHMDDWLRACKAPGRSACTNFGISGPYTEWVLLGNIAEKFDGNLEWDAENLLFLNEDKANEYIKPRFREGWAIQDI